MPDREVAARLAALRRESVDLERRLRGDDQSAAGSAEYWLSQIGVWRAMILRTLAQHAIAQRSIAQIPSATAEDPEWSERALQELLEVRAKLDATIERLEGEG